MEAAGKLIFLFCSMCRPEFENMNLLWASPVPALSNSEYDLITQGGYEKYKIEIDPYTQDIS